MITQSAFKKSAIQYGAPVWFPTHSYVAKLQVVENAALRVVIGFHRTASVRPLRHKAPVLPVDDFLSRLSKQYLASSLVLGHPSHRTVTAYSGPRKTKNTLQARFCSDIRRYIHDGLLDPSARTDAIKALHFDLVTGYFQSWIQIKSLVFIHPHLSGRLQTYSFLAHHCGTAALRVLHHLEHS